MGSMMTDGMIGSRHNRNKTKAIKESRMLVRVLLQCVQLRGPQKDFRKQGGVRATGGSGVEASRDM